MQTRIPLPGDFGEAFNKGIDTGSTLFQRMIQPVIARKQLEQQQNQLAQQHEHYQGTLAARLQQMAQAQQQHEQNLALRQQGLNLKQEAHDFTKEQQPLNLDLLRAKTEKEKALAEKAKREPSSAQKPSELERIAKHLAKGDPALEQELLAQGAATKYGLEAQNYKDLPLGSRPFKSLTKTLQAQENADQIKMQIKVNDSKKAYHDLEKMEKIINENPGMAQEFTYILGNPEDKSFMATLARKYSDKKKLAAIETFTKYSNDFVLSAGGSLGNNFTDAKLKALQLSKMHPGNTDVANKAIIANYKERLKPLINYGKELRKARGLYTLPYFEENYMDKKIEELTDEELAKAEKEAPE